MNCDELENHIFLAALPAVRKACKPLFNRYAVDYFCYHRRYQDGQLTFLATDRHMADLIYKEGNYQHTWTAAIPFEHFRSGMVLWDIASYLNTPEINDVLKIINTDMKQKHGIEMIDKRQDYFDIYSFSSCSKDIYQCSFNFLQRFIFHFRQECLIWLREAHNHRIYLPNTQAIDIHLPIMQHGAVVQNHESNPFNTKKYYLGDICENIYLTQKELKYLFYIAEGYTAKETANHLNLSVRTIENHLYHVKEKLQCNRVRQVIRLLKEEHLLA